MWCPQHISEKITPLFYTRTNMSIFSISTCMDQVGERKLKEKTTTCSKCFHFLYVQTQFGKHQPQPNYENWILLCFAGGGGELSEKLENLPEKLSVDIENCVMHANPANRWMQTRQTVKPGKPSKIVWGELLPVVRIRSMEQTYNK